MIANKFTILPAYGLGRGTSRAYVTGGLGITTARITVTTDGSLRIVETPVLDPRIVEEPKDDLYLVEYANPTIIVAFPAADRVVAVPTIDARYIQGGSDTWARLVEWERVAHPVPATDPSRVVVVSQGGVRIIKR